MCEEKKENEREAVRVKEGGKAKKKVLPLTLGLTAGVLILVYLSGAYYFRSHFLPGTVIRGDDCSYRSLEQAVTYMEERASFAYALEIVDWKGDTAAVLKPEDINMSVSAENALDTIMGKQNSFFWVYVLFAGENREETPAYKVSYDREKVKETLEKTGMFSTIGAVRPEDARISEYRAETSDYELIPEKEGTLLNKAVTLERVYEALERQDDKLVLRGAGCYEQPEVTAKDDALLRNLSARNRMVATKITYDWNGNEEILDGDIIHGWIVEEAGRPVPDRALVGEYVAGMSKAYDTYGRKRKFTTSLGVELTLPSGGYGWLTDRNAEIEALITLINEGAVTEREPVYTTRGYVKGKNDIGPSYVEADMTNQHLYLYLEGELALETDFVSGDMTKGNATPPGVFGITYKTKNAVLRGETYETPVTYWMPFNGNVGMHDAAWRRDFGGEIFQTNGSHGCINLPVRKAEEIYRHMETGFPVVCYYY